MQVKVNSLVAPFIDSTPRFSWTLPEGEFSSQKGYRITVARDEELENVIFRKDGVGDQCSCVYCDVPLEPCRKYYVLIDAFLENGKKYSARTYFATGFLGSKWEGYFITGGNAIKKDDVLPAVYLRREFDAEKPLRATLYVVGLGYFEARINGEKVGDDFLSTPYTAYDKSILYRAFDVTGMIRCGANALGVILGNGFYNSFTKDAWQSDTAPWRDVPKLKAELHLEYAHGAERLVSDSSWRYVEGPIRFNGIRHGEEYDAGFEKDGWDMSGYNGEQLPVRYVKDPGAALSLMEMEPVRVRRVYKPCAMRKVKNGTLYELSQNIAGVASITFRGRAGSRYTVRYCDRLHPDGELDQEALSGFIKNYCFQTDVYTKRSDEPETYHATFSYYGIQYIEVSGEGEHPMLEDIEAWALCNDMEQRSSFSCSDETVNAIERLCHASTTSCCVNTFASDAVREKSSWTGDTGLSAEQLMINYGAENLMRKWQRDLRDAMRPCGCLPCIVPSPGWGYNSLNGPDWSHPMVDVPWNLYMEYGDIEVLRENYAALCAHVSYIESMSHGYIASYGLGDWCAPFDGPAVSVNMESYKCPLAVSDTAFFHSAARMAEKCARLLGYTEEAEKHALLADKVKDAFRSRFYDAERALVYGDCQSATALMMYHGLANEEEIPSLMETLLRQIEREDGHLDFGVLGCKAVMESLGRYGRADVGISLLTNPTYPSMKVWLDMGSTTLLECWNGGGSRNHHMFSCVSAFFHKYVGGISASEAGYKRIDFRPAVDSELSFARATVNTPYGKAECCFEKADGAAIVDVTVPRDCEGTLYVGEKTYRLSAGKHRIKCGGII